MNVPSLTHHKISQVPESVVDTAVLPAPTKPAFTATAIAQSTVTAAQQPRRKSSLAITVDGSEHLLEAALGAVHQLASQRELNLKDPTNRRQQLIGRKLLFVCCGHDGLDSKRFTFELAQDLGVRGFLLEDGRNTLAITLEKNKIVEKFIPVDMTPRSSLLVDVVAALIPIQNKIGGFDGVCTFWDDAVGLCARIAERLGLPGNPVRSVDIAHDKYLTRQAMKTAGLPTPASYLLKCETDIARASQEVGVPAILKPMYGASSLGVAKVEKLDVLLETYRQVLFMLKEFYEAGELMGLTFGDEECSSTFEDSSLSWLVMEEFLDGDEVDVDLLLRDGKVRYQCVVDDWPQIQPWFAEMGNTCPSSLPQSDQQGLIQMAVETVTSAMGFQDGLLHCELKSTSKGPRIIEVNPRMGGGPVWSLHKLSYGIDLVEEQLYSAIGISGTPAYSKIPKQCVSCGEKFFNDSMIVPKEFCKVVETMRLFPNVLEATPLVKAGERIVGIKDGFPTRCARFVVYADTSLEAQNYAMKLLDMCEIPQVVKAQAIGAPFKKTSASLSITNYTSQRISG